MTDLALLLGVLAALLGLARVFGSAATRVGQPAVVGEIACGLVLGVVLAAGGVRLPDRVESTVDTVAQLGLVLFVFCVGAHIAPSVSGRRVTAALPLACWVTVVPFVAGAALALPLARHAPAGTWVFVLFAGAAMSVTAFPVLARILAERGLLDREDGQRALVVAAITDAVAWLALAVVVAGLHGGSWSTVLVVPFLLLLFGLARIARRTDRISGSVTLLVVVACGCAAVTETAGLHCAIGAFLAGIAVGRGNAGLVVPIAALLAPLYFVQVGRRVDIGSLDALLLLEIGAVVGVAVLGKVGGGYLGARIAGHPPRTAAVFGVLMNTRGITELVFVAIGLELGVIDSAFYTAMVVMALVTTAMTGPLLDRLKVGATTERGVLT